MYLSPVRPGAYPYPVFLPSVLGREGREGKGEEEEEERESADSEEEEKSVREKREARLLVRSWFEVRGGGGGAEAGAARAT